MWAKERGELGRLFSNKPLGFEHLHHADIDLKLIVDNIEGEHLRTGRLELTVEVANGRFKAHHNELKHQDGAISTALEVDNATDPPRVTFEGRGDNIPWEALYVQGTAQPRPHEGLYSFDIGLTGSGHSPHALLATANGHYGHVLENAKLVGGDLDTLNFGLLRLVMASAVSKDHTDIDCSITKFRVNNGLWASDTLFLTTPKMVAAGTGHFNFSDETLDLVVHTETKRLLLRKKAVLRIHGAMQQPEVDADLKDAAVTAGLEAAALGAAIVELPPLGFFMAGLENLEEFITDGEQQPCVSGDLSKK